MDRERRAGADIAHERHDETCEAGVCRGGIRKTRMGPEHCAPPWNSRTHLRGHLCVSTNFRAWRGLADRLSWRSHRDPRAYRRSILRPDHFRRIGLVRAVPARCPAARTPSTAKLENLRRITVMLDSGPLMRTQYGPESYGNDFDHIE